MPQFLRERYDERVSTIMAVFWLLLYVFVNLTSIIYLGALSLQNMLNQPFEYCAIGLSLFAIVITLGGMRVIGYTDVIQVFFLIVGDWQLRFSPCILYRSDWERVRAYGKD